MSWPSSVRDERNRPWGIYHYCDRERTGEQRLGTFLPLALIAKETQLQQDDQILSLEFLCLSHL